MKLVTFSEQMRLTLHKSTGTHIALVDADRPYVFQTSQLMQLMHNHQMVRDGVNYITELSVRLQNFRFCSPHAGNLLLYNGSGGLGDQIMTWPLAKFLADAGYNVHILADSGNQVCWGGFSWIKSVMTLPVPYEQFKLFDHHVIFDYVSNVDEHPDQPHTVDAMFHRLGISPKRGDIERVIRPVFTETELEVAASKFEGKDIALFQLTGSAAIRAAEPKHCLHLLHSLAEAFPDIHWLATYDVLVPKPYVEGVKLINLPNVEAFFANELRELWAMTPRAKVVVGPDSLMSHVAGVLSVPCVSYWGPTHPATRIAYYDKIFPIFNHKACKHAGCNHYGPGWSRHCPALSEGEERSMCDVIASVTPEQLIDQVSKAIALAT